MIRKTTDNRPPTHHTAGAFTLIELLVVVAIITMLIAILLPALDKARREAKQSVCTANLKSIGSSARVYEADDPNGWGIPVHPLQYAQDPFEPTLIGAYEWGGKSGIGNPTWAKGAPGPEAWNLGSKYGTFAGFGPASRPLNDVLYAGGFTDHSGENFSKVGGRRDTELDLGLFRCPADDGPPRGAHCPDWLRSPDRSSYDHFGTSYAANVFMVGDGDGGGTMKTNSPYLRPITRVPTPSRTLYFEENIGRWAWACKRERPSCQWIGEGVDPGPTKQLVGWHGVPWEFTRAFVDSHAETQRIYFEGTENGQGYALHYRNEHLSSYPDWPDGTEGSYERYQCITVRGDGWAKDTLPAPVIETGLAHLLGGRPSYEGCVD